MKKVTLFTLMMVILMFTSITQAEYRVKPFAVYAGDGTQDRPDIDGDIVVWQDSDTNIYWKQIDSPNGPNVIDSGGTQTYPAISGDVVVWYDNHTYSGTQRDIYGYNLQDGSALFITSNDDAKQWYPDISGNIIVWEDQRNGADIYLHRIAEDANEIVCDHSGGQYRPAIDANLVVWMDARDGGYQIYKADISGSSPYTTSIVHPNDSEQWNPAVSGNLIVWEQLGSGTVTLVAYDLGQSTVVWEHTVSGNNAYPAVSNGIVVWQEYNGSTYDILAVDLADVGSAFFEVSGELGGDNQLPAVFADTLSGKKTIVWQHDGDIWATELRDPSTVTVTDPNGGESYLAGDEIDISWTTTGPVDKVDIAFSSDGKETWDELSTVSDANSYTWTSFGNVNSTDCWIRVINPDDDNDEATDISNEAFEVYKVPDSITVTDPNGGEQFLAGSEIEIKWTSTGGVSDVKILFSSDNKQTWDIVTATTENDGEFIWDSNEITKDVNSVECFIQIIDAAASGTWDMSDNPFTFFQCEESLTADLTGDCFVGIDDFAEFAYQWLDCGNPHDETWCIGQ